MGTINTLNLCNPVFLLQIDEQLVLTSGKLLILDRMLPELKKRGHKVKHSLFWLFETISVFSTIHQL